MEKRKVLQKLIELQAVNQELLAEGVMIADRQLEEIGDVCLDAIYEELARTRTLNAGQIKRRVKASLDILGYRGNKEEVLIMFGKRANGRIRVTPKAFFYTMVTRLR